MVVLGAQKNCLIKMVHMCGNKMLFNNRERSGSVVECLTRDREAFGSSLTSVTVLCP